MEQAPGAPDCVRSSHRAEKRRVRNQAGRPRPTLGRQLASAASGSRDRAERRAAFIIIYLLSTILVGLPVMISSI